VRAAERADAFRQHPGGSGAGAMTQLTPLQQSKEVLGPTRRAPVVGGTQGTIKDCIKLWGSQYKKDTDLLEQVQRRAIKMIRGLEHLSCEERLRELGLLSLEKRRLQGNLIVAFPYLKGAYKKDRERLFSKACSYRTRDKGFKLKEGRFRLYIRKKLFFVRVVRHWNRLPREAVDV